MCNKHPNGITPKTHKIMYPKTNLIKGDKKHGDFIN